jgi:hypothetical protein
VLHRGVDHPESESSVSGPDFLFFLLILGCRSPTVGSGTVCFSFKTERHQLSRRKLGESSHLA